MAEVKDNTSVDEIVKKGRKFWGDNKGFTFIKIAGDKIAAGTPPYMPPEQFDAEADERSDIYRQFRDSPVSNSKWREITFLSQNR